MVQESSGIRDAVTVGLGRGRAVETSVGMSGLVVVELFGPDGDLKHYGESPNLITTAGDQFYAQNGVNATITQVNGMKLGSGTNPANNKSAAGFANLQTYIAGTNLVFDGGFPSAAAKGGDTGWNITYKVTWAAGVPSGTITVNEVVIVNDAASNATTSVANTISRAVVSTVTKTSLDSLAITWVHTFLGS